jgi:hypothetical protein
MAPAGAQDRRDFQAGQGSAASMLATVAEERLDDGGAVPVYGPARPPDPGAVGADRGGGGGRPGRGGGLAIVARLATANGGSAALSDTPGGGLTVTIDLPLDQTPDGAAHPANPAPKAGRLGEIRPS